MVAVNQDIKFIVFDIYGVIITSGHNIKDLLFPIFPQHKTHRYSRRVYHYYATNKISREIFWPQIGDSQFTLENKFFYRHRLDKSFYQVIEYLNKKNKKLFILSNIPREWSDFLAKKFAFDKYFIGQLYSWQVGLRKPNPKIFQSLHKKFNLNISQTLFIDDNINNIRAAKSLGFITCWFDREKSKIDPLSADFKITSLKQLIEII